jgi:enamine deaminase RidA (YjgF/YER057c/UK114 family)
MPATAILPDGWKRPRGWSHGTLHGSEIAVAGQFGWDPTTFELVGDDFAAQWGQSLANVVGVVAAPGGEPHDVLSLRVYVTDMEAYRAAGSALGAGWQSTFGAHFPAITLVEVGALTEPGALVEIEATARIGS